jgi:RNA ligase (TIGR02306 family)
MSTHAVKVERIVSVEDHPNADRLDLVQVLDWRCVARKGEFKAGDLAVYIPIDSLLPQTFEDFLFPPDSKIKLDKHRIKTIKLRGAISQGLVIPCSDVDKFHTDFVALPGPQFNNIELRARWKEGWDVTESLGITKYEPPAPRFQGANNAGAIKTAVNPNFRKYTSIENAKNYPGVFQPGEPVIVTEKIHGTNFRAGFVPTVANTFWKKVKKFFGRLPEYEFVFGSHNIQLQDRPFDKTFYVTNLYAEIVQKYDLKTRLLNGEVIYGEIYGAGVQKDYTYGHADGQRSLVVFDAMFDGQYKNAEEHMNLGLPTVPVLYEGPYDHELILQFTKGASVLCPSQAVREGIVVKPRVEATHPMIGRKILKFINDDYLLGDQSEYH